MEQHFVVIYSLLNGLVLAGQSVQCLLLPADDLALQLVVVVGIIRVKASLFIICTIALGKIQIDLVELLSFFLSELLDEAVFLFFLFRFCGKGAP